MNKAEEYAKSVEEREGTLWGRFIYKRVWKKKKKAAKKEYTGRWFDDIFINEYVKNKLKYEGFKLKKGKGEKTGYILVEWIYD